MIISFLLLSSCINEYTLHNSFPIQLLHGNSAKVWILTKSSDPNDKNIAEIDSYRKTFIFYSNDRFREQELINLGSNKGLKGRFKIDEYSQGELVLTLKYSRGEKAIFLIQEISNDLITIMFLDGSNTIWDLRSLKPPKL